MLYTSRVVNRASVSRQRFLSVSLHTPKAVKGTPMSRFPARSFGTDRGFPDRGQGEDCYDLYFDGAARGNPGPAGAGCLLKNASGRTVWEGYSYEGNATNNRAEYRGLILALQAAAEAGIPELNVYGDSKLVIEQMRGLWQVKSHNLRPLHTEAQQLTPYFNDIFYEHISREDNCKQATGFLERAMCLIGEADELANRAIDTRSSHSRWIA